MNMSKSCRGEGSKSSGGKAKSVEAEKRHGAVAGFAAASTFQVGVAGKAAHRSGVLAAS